METERETDLFDLEMYDRINGVIISEAERQNESIRIRGSDS